MNDAPLPPFLSVQSDGIVLSLKVQPRASTNQIGEPLGNGLRVKVTAPPVDAAANNALIEFLSGQLDYPRNILRGQTSRHKIVKIYGVSAEHVLERLTGPP